MKTKPFNARDELLRLDAILELNDFDEKGHGDLGRSAHFKRIELELMAEANDLQRNRNVLLDRIGDKLQILTESIDAGVTMLEQINDRMPLR